MSIHGTFLLMLYTSELESIPVAKGYLVIHLNFVYLLPLYRQMRIILKPLIDVYDE